MTVLRCPVRVNFSGGRGIQSLADRDFRDGPTDTEDCGHSHKSTQNHI